jgi:hypothetical protein
MSAGHLPQSSSSLRFTAGAAGFSFSNSGLLLLLRNHRRACWPHARGLDDSLTVLCPDFAKPCA